MATKKRSLKKNLSDRPDEPKADRPVIPKEYGVPNDDKGLLSWSHLSSRMLEAKYYWICTVSPEGHPHSTPVDGIWIDDKLYFGGSVKTRRHRNLTQNPNICVHLENGIDVVILRGLALELSEIDNQLATRLAQASKEKYGYGPPPEAYLKPQGVIEFRPKSAMAWKQFPKDVTRWRIEEE